MAKGKWYHEAVFLAPKSTYAPLLFLLREPFSELALWCPCWSNRLFLTITNAVPPGLPDCKTQQLLQNWVTGRKVVMYALKRPKLPLTGVTGRKYGNKFLTVLQCLGKSGA